MLVTQRISERALSHYLECPTRSVGSVILPELPVLACSEETARWLITEICAGRKPSAHETRGVFDARWKETAYFRSRDSLSPKKLEEVRASYVPRDALLGSSRT